jgi:LytTr DNA-binding domain
MFGIFQKGYFQTNEFMWQDILKPQYVNWRWGGAALMSIYINVFIATFKPLEGDKLTYVWTTTTDYWLHLFLNCLIVFGGASFAMVYVPKIFPKFFNPETFNIKKLTILHFSSVLIISSFFFLCNAYFFKYDLTLSWYLIYLLNMLYHNLILTSFPFIVAFLLFFTYAKEQDKVIEINDLEKKEGENPTSLTEERTPQYNTPFEPAMLVFSDNSNKKMVQVPLENLYYITSAQNYIEVFYKNKNAENTRTVLRNSLKAIEEDMIDGSDLPLIRCHKAFIVNLDKVIELRGPAKMAQFILKDIDATIPVSRQKFTEIKSNYPNLF